MAEIGSGISELWQRSSNSLLLLYRRVVPAILPKNGLLSLLLRLDESPDVRP